MNGMNLAWPAIDGVLSALWNASWQGGLFALGVALFVAIFPATPARVQAWLWRLAMLKFLIVLALPTAIALPLLPAPMPAVDLTARLEVPLEAPAEMGAVIHAGARTASPVAAAEAQSPLDPALLWAIGGGLAVLTWAILCGWQMRRLIADYLAVRRWTARCEPLGRGESTALDASLAAACAALGIRRAPRVMRKQGGGSPCLVGLWRPAIVLPMATWERLSAREQALALGHELAHLVRRDLAWSLVAAIARTLFAFHPLVWWCERRLHLAQELAADELAIERQQHDPLEYGSLLLAVIGKSAPAGQLPAMSLGTAGPLDSLRRRILAMRTIGSMNTTWRLAAYAVLALVATCGVVPWKLVAAEPKTWPEIIAADDFWTAHGASIQHPHLGFEHMGAIRELAGTAPQAAIRIRAFKLLLDHHGRSRIAAAIPAEQSAAAIAGSFRYLETHLDDPIVRRMRPELGFTHLSLTERSPADGKLWLLIESTDGFVPSAGLNICWDPAAQRVDRIDHWGAIRSEAAAGDAAGDPNRKDDPNRGGDPNQGGLGDPAAEGTPQAAGSPPTGALEIFATTEYQARHVGGSLADTSIISASGDPAAPALPGLPAAPAAPADPADPNRVDSIEIQVVPADPAAPVPGAPATGLPAVPAAPVTGTPAVPGAPRPVTGEGAYVTPDGKIAPSAAASDADINYRILVKSLAVAESELRRAQEALERYPKAISENELDRLKLTVEKLSLQVEQARRARPAPAADPNVGEVRVARLTVTQLKPGEAKSVIFSPMIAFSPGREATVEIGAKEVRIVATIESDLKQQPPVHAIVVRAVEVLPNGTKRTLESPAMTIRDQGQGKVVIDDGKGLTLECEAIILKVNTNGAPIGAPAK